MISRVRGVLVRREPGLAEVLTPGGITYELEIPLSTYERLPREGADLELRTVLVVREDAHTLYGFLEAAERSVFMRLLTASGVGPRLALNMLSTMPAERLVRAIHAQDIPSLRQIPGLGTKKAQRLVLELADRLDDLALEATRGRADGDGVQEAVGALVALGYSVTDASAAVRRVVDAGGSQQPADLIRAALVGLGKAR